MTYEMTGATNKGLNSHGTHATKNTSNQKLWRRPPRDTQNRHQEHPMRSIHRSTNVTGSPFRNLGRAASPEAKSLRRDLTNPACLCPLILHRRNTLRLPVDGKRTRMPLTCGGGPLAVTPEPFVKYLAMDVPTTMSM